MSDTPNYRGYRFPSEIIAQAVWLYHRFKLSFRDVEDLLAERGVTVSYETIRQWCRTFGPQYARRIKRRLGPRGDRWFLDEVVVSIRGKRRYLWRAVDQDGDLIDILVQNRFHRIALEQSHASQNRPAGNAPKPPVGSQDNVSPLYAMKPTKCYGHTGELSDRMYVDNPY